jgi:hypothetical protein
MTEKISEYLGRESEKGRKMMVRTRKERKEGANCAMRRERQLSICGK